MPAHGRKLRKSSKSFQKLTQPKSSAVMLWGKLPKSRSGRLPNLTAREKYSKQRSLALLSDLRRNEVLLGRYRAAVRGVRRRIDQKFARFCDIRCGSAPCALATDSLYFGDLTIWSPNGSDDSDRPPHPSKGRGP